MNYDGDDCKILNIKVSGQTNAGLFGTLTDSTVSELELVDFNISGGNAGSLVGSMTGTSVSNVIAYHSLDADGAVHPVDISGTDKAGGLVGACGNSSSVSQCAAALVVSGSGDAGGLVGNVSGGTIERSYSGGHTYEGQYKTDSFNVSSSSGCVGGLVGRIEGAGTKLESCYSTCSVGGGSGSGRGGLAGTITGGIIENCYATGLVSQNTNAAGAFIGDAGSGSITLKNNYYLEIINNKNVDSSGSGSATVSVSTIKYLKPVVSNTGDSVEGITAIDQNLSTYSKFLEKNAIDGEKCVPYDKVLAGHYNSKYPYKTIEGLSGDSHVGDLPVFLFEHHGDWPEIETMVVNVK